MPKSNDILKKVLSIRYFGSFKGLPKIEWPQIREVGNPIVGKTPALKNIKDAFDIIKSGKLFFNSFT